MKTFLWTSLFWIILVIAGLLCLGFGNLGTQVLENDWIAIVMPKNLKAESCEAAVESALQNIDLCAEAEANNCYQEAESSEMEIEGNDSFQQALENIVANQQIIYNYLQESFANTNQAINNIQINNSQVVEEPVIDVNEQRRLEIQSQMEALQEQYSTLQNEMASL